MHLFILKVLYNNAKKRKKEKQKTMGVAVYAMDGNLQRLRRCPEIEDMPEAGLSVPDMPEAGLSVFHDTWRVQCQVIG